MQTMGLPSKVVELNQQITAIRNSGSEANMAVVDTYTLSKMVKLRLVHGINSRPLAVSGYPIANSW